MRPVPVIAIVLALTATTRADLPTIDSELPPTIAFGAVEYGLRVERIAIEIHSAPAITWVKVTLAGRERLVTLPIDVPEGTRILGMSLASDRGGAWSKPVPASHPLGRRDDGAVLAWRGRSAAQDHVELRVIAPATIEIGMQLPALMRLAIDTRASRAGLASVEIDGRARKTWKASRGREVIDLSQVIADPGELPAVDPDTSLVAAVVDPSAFFEAAPQRFFQRSLDKAMIRRRMKQHRPQLRRCYEQVVQFNQWDPPRGGVILTFWIGDDGAVHDASIRSDLPDRVQTCLVAEILRWEFPASDETIQVNYPIEFRLAGR